MGNISFGELLQIAKKHWLAIVAATLIMGVLAGAASYVTASVSEGKHYAVATLYCSDSQFNNDSGYWVDSYQQSYMANDARVLITSNSVITKALAGTGIAADDIVVTSPRAIEDKDTKVYTNCIFVVVGSADMQTSLKAANAIAATTVDQLLNNLGYSSTRLLENAVELEHCSAQLDFGVEDKQANGKSISKKAIVLGLGLGFCGAIFFVWCLELLGTTVRSRRDVEVGLALPVLAEVSAKRGDLNKQARFVRSALQVPQEGAAFSVLNLGSVSADPALAKELASCFASSRYKTLFIDADLQRQAPVAAGKSLSSLLDEPLASVDKNAASYDSLLLVGKDQGDLFASQQFSAALDTLRSSYDVLIINLPCMAEDADVAAIVSNVPDTVLCLNASQGKTPVYRRALERIALVGARVQGVVLFEAEGKR